MVCFFLFTFTNLKIKNKKSVPPYSGGEIFILQLALNTNYFENILFYILRIYSLFCLVFEIAKKILTPFLTKAFIFDLEINWFL